MPCTVFAKINTVNTKVPKGGESLLTGKFTAEDRKLFPKAVALQELLDAQDLTI